MLAIPPLAAEQLFNIAGLPITNSYINSLLALVGFIIFAFFLNKGIKKYYFKNLAPKGLLNFLESILALI